VRPALAEVGDDALAGRWDACRSRLDSLARERGVCNDNGRPLRFVDSRGVDAPAYEHHIWHTGEVPTRSCAPGAWHDLFNALVWLAFPRTKAVLNRLQAQAIAADGIGARRGGVRDAATLFDENAVLFVSADADLTHRLRAFDWTGLFVAGRAEFGARVRVIGFGHALLDKLRTPYKAICAHAWVLDGAQAAAAIDALAGGGLAGGGLDRRGAAVVDALASDSLRGASLRPGAFAPLPVLGIPGWWADNADPAFYDDPAVFRPGRGRRLPVAGHA